MGEWPHLVLGNGFIIIAAAKGDVFVEWPITNYDARRMDAGVAGEPFEHGRVAPELLGGFLGGECLLQFGVLFNRAFQCDSEFVRNHFSDAVGVGIAQSHHSSNIADYALRAQCAKGNDLRYGSGTTLFLYGVDSFPPPILAKIPVVLGRT